MAFTKIKETDKTGKKITELSDTPQISAEEAKARFDALPELAIQFLNNLIDDLGKNTSAESIGAKSPDGISADSNTVQAVIDAVAKIITDNKGSYDLTVKLLNGISEISNTVKNSESSIPTGKAIVSYVTELGGGDMQKSVYDVDNDGVVDNSAKLGGNLPSVFQKVTDNTLSTTDKTVPGAINELFVMAQNGGKNLVGDEFSIDKAYAVGDYCIYENVLYKFTSEKESGAWDAGKVTSTTCADEFKTLNSKIKVQIDTDSGTFEFTKKSGLNTDIVVTFSAPFNTIPDVNVGCSNANYMTYSVKNITHNSFVVSIVCNTSSYANGTITFTWDASASAS